MKNLIPYSLRRKLIGDDALKLHGYVMVIEIFSTFIRRLLIDDEKIV